MRAVAACARTLGEAPDADADLALTDAVTLGPLRAAADRAALRARFHHALVFAAHRPGDGASASLYDSLERARLDALGVHWLAGVAHNLRSFPGLDNDGLRWLAFEVLSGSAAPIDKAQVVALARAATPEPLVDRLVVLADLQTDAAAFAVAAAQWCEDATGQVPVDVAHGRAPRFSIPDAPGGVDLRRGRYALPGRTAGDRRSDATESGDHTEAPRPDDDPVAALVGYRAYTTAFDRVVTASTLASRDELEQLRASLDADVAQVRSVVARVAKRLMRVLMAKQTREWRFDQDDGFLDPARLPAFVASGGAARPFKQEFESPFPSTVVTLLIDHSGSMAGRPMKIAALTVEVFARVLERCGVTCEVLGFTTQDWDGGEPARQWAADGYPEGPGRLNALEHVVIKAADTPWRRARLALGLFLRDEMLKENIDGEALTWAHRRLLARPEQRRVLIVVSDGAPMDEATFAANGFDYLDGHLMAVVRHIERHSPVKLAAIGIGVDVSQFYSNATRIRTIDDLGVALTGALMALLGDQDR